MIIKIKLKPDSEPDLIILSITDVIFPTTQIKRPKLQRNGNSYHPFCGKGVKTNVNLIKEF